MYTGIAQCECEWKVAQSYQKQGKMHKLRLAGRLMSDSHWYRVEQNRRIAYRRLNVTPSQNYSRFGVEIYILSSDVCKPNTEAAPSIFKKKKKT